MTRLLFVLVLTGCTGIAPNGATDSTDAKDGSSKPGDEVMAEFEPQPGTWVVTESELTKDDCGLEDKVDRGEPGSTMVLKNTVDRSFELIFGAGGEVVSCLHDISGLYYTCETTEDTNTEAQDMGLDALILVDITSRGMFVEDDEMTLNTVVDLDCEGQHCNLVQVLMGTSFPCSMRMESLTTHEVAP